MHSNEKPIILVVTTLFLAFTLVYMMFFRVRDASENNMNTNSSSGMIFSGSLSGSDPDSLIDSLLIDTGVMISGNMQTGTSLSGQGIDRVVLQTGDDTPLSGSTNTSGGVNTGSFPDTIIPVIVDNTGSLDTNSSYRYKRIDNISGVTVWYNSVKMAEVLGLDVQTVFTDTGNILYAYLGTGQLTDLASTVKRLQGNILAIDTKIDIVKNGLPGDRIRYINIPQFTFVRKNGIEEKIMVAMIVNVGSDQRLIQSPYDIYHGSKKRMITIFEQLYK